VDAVVVIATVLSVVPADGDEHQVSREIAEAA